MKQFSKSSFILPISHFLMIAKDQLSIITKLAVFLISFLILARFNVDPDLGWHLALGRQFLESGEIIKEDQFSWTLPGYEWGNRYFVYQIVVAFLFEKIGYFFMVILFGIIGALTVLLLSLKINFAGQKFVFWKFLAIALGVGISVSNLGFRPHMVSFLVFAVLLILCERKFFQNAWQGLFWFVFFAVWANLQQAFFVGIFFFLAFMVIDFFWQLKSGKFRAKKLVNRQIFVSTVCGLAAVLGGLVTPFHTRLWFSLVDDLFGGKTWMAISEWQPIVIFLPISILYALSGIIFIYIFFKKIREIEPVWFLLGTFMFMLPFLAANFVLFWAAIFIFMVSRYFEVNYDFGKSSFAKLPLVSSCIAVAIALVLAFLINALESLDLDYRLRRDGYPVAAVDFLKNESYSGNLFNNYGWGGYLEWYSPNVPVFIDGRMTGWRKPDRGYILADYLAILEGKCEVVEKYNIETVLVETGYENKCFSGFQIVYKDSVAKVLVKD